MISERAKRIGIKELDIFDRFEVDLNLPKYKKSNTINDTSVSEGSFVINSGETGIINKTNKILTFFKFNKIFKIFNKKKNFSVSQFFLGLSKSINDLETTTEIANYYERAILHANENGQTALVEKLSNLIFICKNEANLVDMHFTKYVTEQQIIDFYEKISDENKKHLRLSFIKNYTRLIPQKVIEIKKQLDQKEIFDNYVILYYDPLTISEELTDKEKELMKDPILFGLMSKSRKLYFIADWKDEFCDLTLDEMFLTLGEKVFEINNNTIKSFINTGGSFFIKNKKNKR